MYFYIRSFLLTFLLTCTPHLFSDKKIVIFDLGNVLIGTSRTGVALEVGILNFALCFFSRFDIKQSMFEFLLTLRGPQQQTNQAFMTKGDGIILPNIWYQHMNGEVSGAEVIDECNKNIQTYNASCRQKETMLNLIRAIFNPEILAKKHMYPLKKGCALLAELANQPDVECWILSNLGADTFSVLEERKDMQKAIFRYVAKEHRIVSGNIGISKPHPDIYEYVKAQLIAADERFADPFYLISHCLFIDDQEENIKGAHNAGITSFHLTATSYSTLSHQENDYADLKRTLKLLKYLT